LLILPFHTERRIGEHVVELAAGKAIACFAVAERVAEDDMVGLLVHDEHVRAAGRPAFVIVILPVQAEALPARIVSSDTDSMPPVPQAGSRISRYTQGYRIWLWTG
jgi:hypothetical protein